MCSVIHLTKYDVKTKLRGGLLNVVYILISSLDNYFASNWQPTSYKALFKRN